MQAAALAPLPPAPGRACDLLTEAQRETIRRMRAMEPRPTLLAIGQAIGRSTSRVTIYLREMGLAEERTVHLDAATVRNVIERLAIRDTSLARAARELGVDTKSLSRAIAYHRERMAEEAAAARVERPCISCRQPFLSWDRRRNQRCLTCTTSAAARESEPDDVAVTYAGFDWRPM